LLFPVPAGGGYSDSAKQSSIYEGDKKGKRRHAGKKRGRSICRQKEKERENRLILKIDRGEKLGGEVC